MKKILVIGVGNIYRSDDAAGILVARAISGLRLPGVEVIEASGEGAALMDSWKDAGSVFLIDAVVSGASPGKVRRIDVRKEAVPPEYFHYSTHAFSVAEGVELSRTLGQLPAKMVIYGIEGKSFSAGLDVSPKVREGVREVTARLTEEIKKEAGPAL